MRMWGVKPSMMCRNHLLGEHLEMHMFVGTILKGNSLNGYLEKKFVNTGKIRKRHRELVAEMKKRGFKHNSSLRQFSVKKMGSIDVRANKSELKSRCKKCRRLIIKN